MVERRDVAAAVAKVVGELGPRALAVAGKLSAAAAAAREGSEAGDVGAAHVREPSVEVQGLPLPPQLVEPRVVQVEDWVAGAQGGIAHL